VVKDFVVLTLKVLYIYDSMIESNLPVLIVYCLFIAIF